MNNVIDKPKDWGALFDAFYYHFLLRDFMGKIIPGITFIFAISIIVTDYFLIQEANSSVLYVTNYLLNLSFWTWIILLVVSWIIGLGIQSIAEFLRLIRYYPKYKDEEKENILTESEWHKMYVHFQNNATKNERKEFERMVVIKEACGNMYVSLGFSLIIILISHYLVMIIENFNTIGLLFLTIIFILSLRKFHYIHVGRQFNIMSKCKSMAQFFQTNTNRTKKNQKKS